MTDIPTLIGRMKRYAIDIYMRELNYRAEGDYYTFMYPAPGSITRPDESGYGGGTVLAVPQDHPRAGVPQDLIEAEKKRLTETIATSWTNIRARIDAAIEPWLDIPIGSDFDTPKESCELVVGKLMGAVTQSGGTLSGAGELATTLNRVFVESTSFGGGALDDFKTRYIDDSVARAARMTALTEVVGQGITAEQEIWARAKTDLDALVTEYEKAYEEAHDGKQASAELILTIVGAAVAGAAIFATGGSATAIALAGVGVVVDLAKEIDGQQDKPKDERSFADCNAALGAFEGALTALSDRINDEESALITAIEANITRVKGHADMFQLAPAPIYKWDGGVMTADFDKGRSVATKFMPNAATKASEVASSLPALTQQVMDAILHDYPAGRRIAGAYSEIKRMADLAQQLLEEYAWDLERGAKNLELALNDMANVEETNTQTIGELAKEIESGKTHDGREAPELLNPLPPPRVPSGGRIAQIMQ